MFPRRANDLLGEVRHENVFLCLVRYHDVLEVLHHEYPLDGGIQAVVTHVEWVHFRDAPCVLSNDMIAILRENRWAMVKCRGYRCNILNMSSKRTKKVSLGALSTKPKPCGTLATKTGYN